jgi:nucleotide-binding universal stress UspA family protein
MSIRSLLALVDGGATSENAIAAAVTAGLAFDAHVEVLHVETPVNPYLPVLSAGDGLAAAYRLVDDMAAETRRRTEVANELFQSRCIDAGLAIVNPGVTRGNGSTFAWNLVTGHDNPELARRGRLFDLIVLARPDSKDGGVDSAALEAALFDTGRPVLIAGLKPLKLTDAHVAIAWDGSREAARSVGAALPLLKIASRVSAIAVKDSAVGDGISELAVYLSGHDIRPELRAVSRDERSIADALHQEIKAMDANLTVMGAYGHSIISEFLFGGVTRDMLKDQNVSLFLAH